MYDLQSQLWTMIKQFEYDISESDVPMFVWDDKVYIFWRIPVVYDLFSGIMTLMPPIGHFPLSEGREIVYQLHERTNTV